LRAAPVRVRIARDQADKENLPKAGKGAAKARLAKLEKG
jgi:hypothetical protein